MMEKANNYQLNSQILIEHIEDAKGWLEKAKDYYKQANPIHAEMTLNLAQAEVKHAWELSRRRNVSNKQTTIPKHKFNNLIAVAVSILVFFGLIFGFRKTDINKYLADGFKPVDKNVSTGSDLKLARTDNTKKVLEAESLKTVEPDPEESIEPVSHIAETGEHAELQSITNVAVGTKLERTEPEKVQNQVRVRQVSQFAIDEEALTREASHSLRNGK